MRQAVELARSMSSSLDLDAVLARVTEAVAALSADTFCAIRLIDPAAGGYRLAAVSKPDHGLSEILPFSNHRTHTVAQTRRPLLVEDFVADESDISRFFIRHNLTVYYGVPIEVGEELVGVLNVVFLAGRPPDADEREVIGLLAAQAGVAIRNARLYAESESRRQTAEALAEVSRVLAQTIDPEVVADRVARTLTTLLHTQSAIVFRLEPETGDLAALAFTGTAATYGPNLRFPAGTGVAGIAARDRVPVTTTLNLGDPRVRYASEASARVEGGPDRAILAVPLLIKDRVIGALSVGDRTGRIYEASEIRLAQVFADHAALALEKAWLYREAQESDRRKDAFLAMLAHELRNPLGPIVNAVHVLDHLKGQEPQAPRLRAILRRQTLRLARLVEDLLDISRIRTGKISLRMEPVDVNEVVRRAVESITMSGKTMSHDIGFTPAAETLVARGDPVRLEQVVGNLLDNAVKYSQPGRCIRLAVDRRDAEAVISVQDEGIGIAPDVLPHIFELFTQADTSLDRAQGGLGVGLPLVLHIVRQHGGSVGAKSDGVGRGSEFIVRLPLVAGQVEGPRDQSDGRAPPLSILVVEDNLDAREALRALLEMDGHDVDVAGDGPAGLAQALTGRFNVALVDIGLPGYDGYELARRIRKEAASSGLYLVALTGYGQPSDRRRALEAGFDAHVVKPAQIEELRRVLSAVRTVAPEK